MTAVPNRPPPWVNRDLPRAPLRLTHLRHFFLGGLDKSLI